MGKAGPSPGTRQMAAVGMDPMDQKAPPGLREGLSADLQANGGSLAAGGGAAALALRVVMSPAVRACALMRLAASAAGPGRWLWRNLLITFHGTDVDEGAIIGPGLRLPHPWGIVIGPTVRTGTNVEISHNVTLAGTSAEAPIWIADDVTIYTGTTVMPGVTIGEGAVIGSNALVSADVEPGGIVRAHTHHGSTD